MTAALPPIADLVPHTGQMVLLDELLDWEPGRARARLCVKSGTPFVHDGQLETSATIEHMAQAVAACLGHEAVLGGEGVRVGMIIACKRFDLLEPVLNVGDECVVEVTKQRGNETLSHFECELTREGKPIASALLTLFHGEPPEGRG